MKKALILFVFLGMALMLSPVSRADNEVTNEKQKLTDIKEELAKQKEILEATKKKEQEALTRLAAVRKDLTKATRELAQANRNIFSNESKIKTLAVEIVEGEEKLGAQNKTLKGRVIEAYKSGGQPYFDLLFRSKSMSDFVNRSYYFGKILEKDIKVLSAIEREYHSTKHKKEELQEATGEIKKLAVTINEKKRSIAKQENEQEVLCSELQRRRAEYERRVAELEKSSIQLEGLIRNKVAQRAKEGTAAPVSSGRFMWPVRGRITSVYGYRRHPVWGGSNFHTGIDIANTYGTSISAADSGEVIFAGWWDGYGKAIVIDHGRGLSTVYGHLSRIYVQAKQNVSKGQVIGLLGSSGYSTGPHLHFEIRESGKPGNPSRWLN